MGFDAWVMDVVRRWWAEACALKTTGLELKQGEGLRKGDGQIREGDGMKAETFD